MNIHIEALYGSHTTLVCDHLPPRKRESVETAILRAHEQPLRLRHETFIEEAIGLLDSLDGDTGLEKDDADLEPGGDDEEALGWPAHASQLALGQNTADGDHTAPERAGAGFVRCGADDLEPTMGATGLVHGSDHLWGWSDRNAARADECEDSHDAEHVNEDGGDINDEPQKCDSENEPSLGAPENHDGPFADQAHWAQGNCFDLHDPDEDEPENYLTGPQHEGIARAGREAAAQLDDLMRRRGRGGRGNSDLAFLGVVAPDGTIVRVSGSVR